MAEEVASEKTLTILAKIKAKQWKAMGKTVEQMREFTEEAGMGDFVSDLKDTLSLQVQDALAPLKNEVNEAIIDALAPIMPQIVAFMTEATEFLVVGIKAWEGILTGNWDSFFEWMNKNVSDDMKKLKNDIRDRWDAFLRDPLDGLTGHAMPAGGQIGVDIGQAIVAGWTGFWRDLGWK